MENKNEMDEHGSNKSTLKAAAEEKLAKSAGVVMELKEKTPEEIIHELRVHQIQLEIQNEPLRRIQLELEESRDKRQGFYDFAPIVGYFTLTHTGVIADVNLTVASLLRIPHPKLIGRGFGHLLGWIESRRR